MSSNKDHTGSKGSDGAITNNKVGSQQSHQKGAKSVSKHDTGKHTKDKSGGADHNTAKKQENSI